jgi:secondary thiamine-phosphate synthase enzyme
MAVHRSTIALRMQGRNDVADVTGRVEAAVRASGIAEGVVTVFVPGSTAGITTIEFEPGAVADLKRAIDRMAPEELHYEHDRRWGDGNGFSHVRAALIGPSVCIPVSGGRMELGTWQQIVLIDFDNRPRSRDVIVQTVGNPIAP